MVDNIGTAYGVALTKNTFKNLLEEILWIMHPWGYTAVAF